MAVRSCHLCLPHTKPELNPFMVRPRGRSVDVLDGAVERYDNLRTSDPRSFKAGAQAWLRPCASAALTLLSVGSKAGARAWLRLCASAALTLLNPRRRSKSDQGDRPVFDGSQLGRLRLPTAGWATNRLAYRAILPRPLPVSVTLVRLWQGGVGSGKDCRRAIAPGHRYSRVVV